MDAERIMERVRRLLAIANDPAASDNEQRIALEQAQRLMDRHAIEEWQLEEDHDAIEITSVRPTPKNRLPSKNFWFHPLRTEPQP